MKKIASSGIVNQSFHFHHHFPRNFRQNFRHQKKLRQKNLNLLIGMFQEY